MPVLPSHFFDLYLCGRGFGSHLECMFFSTFYLSITFTYIKMSSTGKKFKKNCGLKSCKLTNLAPARVVNDHRFIAHVLTSQPVPSRYDAQKPQSSASGRVGPKI